MCKKYFNTPTGIVAMLFAATALLSLILVAGCDKDSGDPASRSLLSSAAAWDDPGGQVVGHGDCKTDEELLAGEIEPFQTAVAWEYDGNGTLSLRHLNGGFNCCFESISGAITFNGRSITVAEQETFGEGGPCDCLCLIDVEYQITDLSPGKYIIRIEELYFEEGDEALEFEVALKGSGGSGIFIVDRDHYPWVEAPETTWMVTDWGAGGGSATCVVTWDYSDNGTLNLRHIRNRPGCCATDLTVDISYEDGAFSLYDIAIEPPFLYMILSLYYYDVEITNLAPGEYQFTFAGEIRNEGWPYPFLVFEPLVLTIDLESQPSGSYCIEL